MYEDENHFRKLLLKQIVFGAFDRGDFNINRVHLIPKTDVWTRYEVGRSMHTRVIDRKQKG